MDPSRQVNLLTLRGPGKRIAAIDAKAWTTIEYANAAFGSSNTAEVARNV